MKSFLSSFISLIYPRTCVNCDRSLVDQEENICLHCLLDLPLTNYHKLDINPLVDKMIGIPHLKDVYAYLNYQRGGIAQKLLHELKYGGNHQLAYQLGKMFAEHISKVIATDIDMIIPIPLHKSRQRRRGYNQAEEIARGFGETLSISIEGNLLKRIRQNTAQAKKARLDRWENAEQLFHVAQPNLIKDKSILILDDVITTGATIDSAALVLTNCNPRATYVACLATGK